MPNWRAAPAFQQVGTLSRSLAVVLILGVVGCSCAPIAPATEGEGEGIEAISA